MREFNPNPQEEGGKPPENAWIDEMQSYEENRTTRESEPISELPPTSPLKKKPKASNRLATLLLALAATATVGSATLPSLEQGLFGTSQPQAELLSFSSDGQNIYYEVEILQGENLYATLKNDFVSLQNALQTGENDGSFGNLKAGMTYTFSVVEDGILADTVLLSRKITVPDPAKAAGVRLLSYRTTATNIFMELDAQSAIPLEATLSRGEEVYTQTLQNGRNALQFDVNVRGAPYLLTVKAKSEFSEQILLQREVAIPPTPNLSVFEVDPPAADGDILYGWANMEGDAPLHAVLTHRGQVQKQALQNGENEIVFPDLIEGATYTYQIVYETDTHSEVLFEETVLVPHPLHYSYVELREFGQAENSVFYAIYIEAEVPLEIVLYNEADPSEQYRKAVDLLLDINGGEFTDLTIGQTYILSVVGQGLYSEEAIFSERITLVDPATL